MAERAHSEAFDESPRLGSFLMGIKVHLPTDRHETFPNIRCSLNIGSQKKKTFQNSFLGTAIFGNKD